MCLLIAKPDYFLQSATAGLALFATSVLPAVFPFFFCATLLTAMGASTSVARLGAKPVRMLFNAAPEGAYVLLLSMLSGYPIGAATIADLYKSGMLNTEEAKRISSFTSTSGPVFMLGTIGTAIFHNEIFGIIVMLSHYLGALATGLIFRGRKKPDRTVACLSSPETENLLQKAITSSTLSMLAVGGYIVIGNMLIDAINLTGLQGLVLGNLPPTAANFVMTLIYGSVEVTRGSIQASTIPYTPLSIAAAAGIVSFGGLSVMIQSFTFLSQCKIGFGSLFVRKSVQCISAFIFAYLFSMIFFNIF